MMLSGRRILITGAARGIGLAVARAALEQGAQVASADIREITLPGVTPIRMDVGQAASVAGAVALAVSALGGLDGLVNNAAILDDSHSATVTEDRFAEVLSTNLTSILRVTQAVLPHLGPGAAIVNTLSTMALAAQPGGVAYATAKGGGLNLTRSLAIDLAPRGIRVNAVAPGFIDTAMAILPDGSHEHQTPQFRDWYLGQRKIPLARAGTPDDCAGAFVFLLSNHAAYITGQCLAVDGGLTATY